MATAVMGRNGRMTVPKPIREQLQLKSGDRLEFRLQDDGSVLLVRGKYRLKDLAGILPRPARALTIEEMDDAIGQHVTELDRATRR